MANRNIEFILAGVPFVIPGGFVMEESSTTTNSPVRLGPNATLKSMPMSSISSSLNVSLSFATGTEFFLNTYGLFKGAIETLARVQTIPGYPDALKFASYIGLNEIMPYGQLQNFSFKAQPNTTNMIQVSLAFERYEPPKNPINLVKGEPTVISVKKP